MIVSEAGISGPVPLRAPRGCGSLGYEFAVSATSLRRSWRSTTASPCCGGPTARARRTCSRRSASPSRVTRAEPATSARRSPSSEALARVEVEVEGDGEARLLLWSLSRDGERRHLVDGKPGLAALPDVRPALAIFVPDRLALIKGPPASRRAHLDRFVRRAVARPCRGAAPLRARPRAAQRPARPGASRRRLEGVAGCLGIGACIDRRRADRRRAVRPSRRWRRSLAPLRKSWDLRESRELRHVSRSDAAEAAELAAELRARREVDLRRGHTTHGPHLDELAVSLGGRALRRFGSQGEQRTARPRAAVRGAAGALRGAAVPAADAPRRRDERARPRPPDAARPPLGRGGGSGVGHRDRAESALGMRAGGGGARRRACGLRPPAADDWSLVRRPPAWPHERAAGTAAGRCGGGRRSQPKCAQDPARRGPGCLGRGRRPRRGGGGRAGERSVTVW